MRDHLTNKLFIIMVRSGLRCGVPDLRRQTMPNVKAHRFEGNLTEKRMGWT
jgi:hypothetical protein